MTKFGLKWFSAPIKKAALPEHGSKTMRSLVTISRGKGNSLNDVPDDCTRVRRMPRTLSRVTVD